MTRAALAIVALIATSPAGAHCFSIWHYKTPQRCADPASRPQPAHALAGPKPTNSGIAPRASGLIDIAVPTSLDDAALQQAIERGAHK
jgi:hypothetical protein